MCLAIMMLHRVAVDHNAATAFSGLVLPSPFRQRTFSRMEADRIVRRAARKKAGTDEP